MLQNVVGVIGTNFGDEGKGLMTDYFVNRFLKAGHSCVVIKHNGGSQAGHTVVTPDGTRHVFGHFGSGTLQGVPTYFDKDFIVNPMTFVKEYQELKKLGYTPECYIHPDCRIQMPVDIIINQTAEAFRGKNKHGSCGMGIWETVVRSQNPNLDLRVKMFDHSADYHTEFTKFLHFVFNPEQYLIDRLADLDIPVTDDVRELCVNENVWNNYTFDLAFMLEHCTLVSEKEIVNNFDSAVFETGQGLLLDEDNEKYMPYLTPSKTGACNIMRFLRENLVGTATDVSVELCYVSRSYMTRHGVGMFPTECNKKYINSNPEKLVDKTNVTNPYQDTLRYGILDLPDTIGRIGQDFLTHAYSVPTWDVNWSMSITHMDETNGKIPSVMSGSLTDMLHHCNPNVKIYVSNGETRKHVHRKSYIKFQRVM
jgi:adenylosuccinate synthase